MLAICPKLCNAHPLLFTRAFHLKRLLLPYLLQMVDSIAISPDRRLSGGASRRLSGGGRRLSGWKAEDVENLFDENDDEAEREAAAKRKAE